MTLPASPVEQRRKVVKIILDHLIEHENEWIALRDLNHRLFDNNRKAHVSDAVAWLTRHEPVFTQTIQEGKRKVKLVSYRPPPPDQCKYCRGKGCLICNGTGRC